MGSNDGRGDFYAEGVRLSRASREIFHSLDFHISRGEIHAVVGAKGVGKSLLASLFSGKTKPESGRVVIPPAVRIARITDRAAVFPRMKIADNLILDSDTSIRSWFRLGNSETVRLRRWLADNSIDLPLALALRELPREDWLFVQILSRLYQNPDLIIFDETLESLTSSRLQQLWPLLEARREAGMAIMWVTNRIESALLRADRVSILRNGRILLTESARRLDRLGLINLCHGFLEVPENDNSSREQFIEIMRFTEALLRDLPSVVIITDMVDRVRFVNRRGGDFFGLDRQWFATGAIGEIIGPSNIRLAETLLEGLALGGEREWHGLTVEAGGGRRLVDVRMRRVKEGDVAVGHLIVMEDVSVREEMRRRLMLSENVTSIGLLAAGVAHEVNNPLEAMENYLNYLSETEPVGERREILGEVTRETHNIKDTVRQLVAFSGHRDAGRVKTDVALLVQRLCGLLRFHVKHRGIEFACTGPDRRVLVVAAPNEMRQMLLNLMRNSVDAMPDGGTIDIAMSVEKKGEAGFRLKLCIDDQGCGIDEERMSDIFLPFVSDKKGHDNHQGLGLWIVYTIVKNCDGDISVSNRPEGGCRFTVFLPCLLEDSLQ